MSAGQLSKISFALYAKVKSLKKKFSQKNDNNVYLFTFLRAFFPQNDQLFDGLRS
jgi:hypothetical protein